MPSSLLNPWPLRLPPYAPFTRLMTMHWALMDLISRPFNNSLLLPRPLNLSLELSFTMSGSESFPNSPLLIMLAGAMSTFPRPTDFFLPLVPMPLPAPPLPLSLDAAPMPSLTSPPSSLMATSLNPSDPGSLVAV